ncbi:MAG: electron transfer complex ferredoxin TmcB [Desulfococcaceae bacterium]
MSNTEKETKTVKIKDAGIIKSASFLTDEQVKKVVNEVIQNETGAKLKTYVDTCVHCGLCSEGCHYYLSHDKDPAYSPAGKVKQTMWEMLKKKGDVGTDAIQRMSEIASTECNLCRRCAMYCPFGIDVAYIMLVVRRICNKLGVTPTYIEDTSYSHSVTMNQMWVKDDEWIDTLQWQEEEAASEIPNLRIPLEKEGADFMYSVIGPEPKFRAQLIYQAAVIFEAAGLDWTMPATPGWDNSDMAMYTGDHEIMGRVKKAHFEKAMQLKVKRIVMGECGHAFRSVYDMGNRWLGWKMPPIPMVHSIEFFHDLFKAGKLRLKKKYEHAVTLHDPCNVVRGRGLHEMARYVVSQTCENFIEMHPNREHNYCCCAGGGVINCGPPYRNTRVDGNRIKAEQLFAAKSRGAKVIIAPCHNCHGGLEDIVAGYGLNMEIKFFGDIIYEILEKPE